MMRQALLIVAVAVVLIAIKASAEVEKNHAAPVRLPLQPRLTNKLTTSMGRWRSRFSKLSPQLQAPVVNLTGNMTYWGEYFITLGLGTPPQYVQLQVDTGSTDLIVYSQDCDKTCKQQGAYFDYSKSKTARVITCDDDDYYCTNPDQCSWGDDPCEWEDDYGGGGDVQGIVLNDMLNVGGLGNVQISLGAIQDVTGPWEPTGVDGIWGLAYSDLSGWQGDSSIDTFTSHYKLYDSFSLCLLEDNGVIEIGGKYQGDSRFTWTEVTDDQWYTVYLDDWRMGNVSLGLPKYDLNWNGVIVDSGTTLLIVDTQIYQAIQKVLLSMCGTNPMKGVCGSIPKGQGLFDGNCIPMDNSDLALFPPLTLVLDKANPLSIDPSYYLWQGNGTAGVYCLGIQVYDDLPVIIGDVFMGAFHTVFDRVQDKVGFGPLSSCPSSQ